MKIKYIGESFGVDSLTNGKIYEAPHAVNAHVAVTGAPEKGENA